MAKTHRDARADPRSSADRSVRDALLAFVLVIAVAFVLFLVLGHRQWFFLDEWDFLVDRNAGSLNDLFRPYHEHWSTLPILAYRGLYQLFGVRTYVPYQMTSIVLHLTTAVLLRIVMRRSGVRPWLATAAASLFALFGTGSQHIIWAFGMTWTTSLNFGLTHLLLADHDGPVDRRDWLGLAAGLAGLLCSGVAVTMTIVVGIAMLVRRGWRIALLHTVPLGAVYVVWWLTMASDSYGATNSDLGNIARFVGTGIGATFDGMGQLPGIGIALGILLVTGLVLAWRGLDRHELRTRAAAPGALLVGGFVFLVISGSGRASTFGPEFARSSRYLHVVAALSLPAVAVAADAIVRRWRVAAPAVIALLLVGIPGNVEAVADYPVGRREIPGWVIVQRTLVQSERPSHGTDCKVVRMSVDRHLDKGQSLLIGPGRVRVFHRKDRGAFVRSVVYDPADGNTLTARTGPINLLVGPEIPGARARICTAMPAPVREPLTPRA